MRQCCLVVVLVTLTGLAGGTADAADLKIPSRSAAPEVSIQQGPPNCSRWTDECVNCSRGASGEPAVCSNIGFACQPKAIRCLSAALSPKQ
jgi:hypothetical protein